MIDNSNIEKVLEILGKEYKNYTKPIVTRISKRKRDPYKILISTIISLRTKDAVTSEVSKALFARADNPHDMLKMSKKKIEKLIYPAGFYHRKAENILEISQIILDEYGGKVPQDLDELLKLPGVGRKTANLVLVLGFDKYGICVDTHVHRISNRWGYVDTKTPEKTEAALRKKLPKKFWKIYNDYLVSFGQNTCKPISPFCSKCPVSELCPQIDVDKHR